MVGKESGWTYVLLEAYCNFHLYKNTKKVKTYTVFDGKKWLNPPAEHLVKNGMYLPKHRLKRPKGCPKCPRYECMLLGCRFFAYSQGSWANIGYKEFKHNRNEDKKMDDIQPVLSLKRGDKHGRRLPR